MMALTDLSAAFLIGFMGSLHCVGMCGSISVALASATVVQTNLQRTAFQLLYNTGRIFSYTIAGAGAGLAGSLLGNIQTMGGPSYLRMIAGVMIILLGLYISGWWRALAKLEQLGSHVWRRLSPISRALMPINTPLKAFTLGMIWGWLPCGLVYSALTWSVTAATPLQGATLMACFGLGTLPALLTLGGFSQWYASIAQKPIYRHAAGILLIGLGSITIMQQVRSVGAL